MASIERREGKPGPDGEPVISWRVSWRNPIRDDKREGCTFGDESLAVRAQKLAEGHRHRITGKEVEAGALGAEIDPKKNRTPLVKEWAETWLKSRTRISSGQLGRYRQQLRDHILPEIGHRRLHQITGTHVSNLLHRLRAAGLSEKTVTRYYSCLHAMLAYAVTEKVLPDNPAKRTDFIRDLVSDHDASDDGEGHVYLTPPLFLRIRAELQPSVLPLVDYLIGTGARFGEATAAPVSSIDLKAGIAKIHRAWKQDERGAWHLGPTKGKGRRGVPIGAGLIETLRPLTEGRQPDDLLFVTEGKGKRWTGGRRWQHSNFTRKYWDRAVGAAMRCEEHPPPLPDKAKTGPRRGWLPGEVSTCTCPGVLRERPTPHDLRHSYTAWMLAAGRPLAVISRRLGHFSVTLTERVYAGILPEVDEADSTVIEAALGRG